MIELNERYVSPIMVKHYIKENYEIDPGAMSGQEVIDRLFGCANNDYYTDFRIIDDCWAPKTKWWHRLNRFWAYPLTWFCSPYQYVVRGQAGWSDKTKFGNWILRVTGYR
ncbi:hypothetical protein LMH73_015955 [Vibrio splendidus]|nr:hypothetical protein [Vibrio splendidus]MCC4880441.1 hypothetical protein [Vibrio splendidus]